LPFGLNVALTLIFNFTVLLSYRAIRMFLVQKFGCPVASMGMLPNLKYKVLLLKVAFQVANLMHVHQI
jgi:hypothetical protein